MAGKATPVEQPLTSTDMKPGPAIDQQPPAVKAELITTPKPTKPKGKGRPTSYTPEVGDLICGLLANGTSLKRICDAKDMPERKTIYNWLRVHDDFLHNYTRAKEDAADAYADDIEEIAAGTLNGTYDPQAARVAIEAKKWVSSKLKPKKYGDKLDITGETTVNHKLKALDDDQLDARVEAAIAATTKDITT